MTNALCYIVILTVTNFNQIGTMRDNTGTNVFEVQQAQVWTNVVLKASYEGKDVQYLFKSEPGPVLYERRVPIQPGPGRAFEIPSPLPIIRLDTNGIPPALSKP